MSCITIDQVNNAYKYAFLALRMISDSRGSYFQLDASDRFQRAIGWALCNISNQSEKIKDNGSAV
jgi:hypothetical protein